MVFQTTRLIKRYRVSQGHLSARCSFFNLSRPRSLPISPFADQDLGIREEGNGKKKRVAINQGFGNQEIGKSVLWERNKTTCTTCGSNRSRSNATGLMLGVKMRSGHSKLLVQGERSVRMSSPQSHTHTQTNLGWNNLTAFSHCD